MSTSQALGMYHCGCGLCNVCLTNDPRDISSLDLGLLYDKVEFVPECIYIGKP